MDDAISKIRLVSWDVDGTLFSFFRALGALAFPVARQAVETGWASTAKDIRETWKFHRAVERQRHRANAMVIASQLEQFARTIALERRILETALQAIRPRNSALELIQVFSAAGVTQVALSDFECAYKLKALGLDHHFTKAYSCRDLGFWKPSPIPLARIQKDFGVVPAEHLHIGDRFDTDGVACELNGCRFALVGRAPRLWRTFNFVCAIGA